MTSMTIFCWSLPMIWRLKPYDLWRDSIPTPWPCFVFFKDIYIPENQRFFSTKEGIISVAGIREYGNTSSSEPTIDFQGSMDANDSSTCRCLLLSGKTRDSANTDANYRRCQKCEKPPENHSTSILFICIRIS